MVADHITTHIRVHTDELDESFLEGVRKMFPHQLVEINIISTPTDETEFLLSDPRRKEALLQSIEEVKEGKTIRFEKVAALKEYLEEIKRNVPFIFHQTL